jgi:hypothetical protein
MGLDKKLSQLMDCPLPTNNTHIIMSTKITHTNGRYCLFRNLRETNKNMETLLFGNDEISINENGVICNVYAI